MSTRLTLWPWRYARGHKATVRADHPLNLLTSYRPPVPPINRRRSLGSITPGQQPDLLFPVCFHSAACARVAIGPPCAHLRLAGVRPLRAIAGFVVLRAWHATFQTGRQTAIVAQYTRMRFAEVGPQAFSRPSRQPGRVLEGRCRASKPSTAMAVADVYSDPGPSLNAPGC
jgi:hypothetical protein